MLTVATSAASGHKVSASMVPFPLYRGHHSTRRFHEYLEFQDLTEEEGAVADTSLLPTVLLSRETIKDLKVTAKLCSRKHYLCL